MDPDHTKRNFEVLSFHLSKLNGAIGDLVSKTERLEQRLLVLRKEFDGLFNRFERDQKDVWGMMNEISTKLGLKEKEKKE